MNQGASPLLVYCTKARSEQVVAILQQREFAPEMHTAQFRRNDSPEAPFITAHDHELGKKPIRVLKLQFLQRLAALTSDSAIVHPLLKFFEQSPNRYTVSNILVDFMHS
jgi:hypothetical protein